MDDCKILGSFSNNSMFFIGSKYIQFSTIISKYENEDFNPIFILDESDTYHHSMILDNDNRIKLLSTKSLDNDIYPNGYFTISIKYIDFINSLGNLIALNEHTYNLHEQSIIQIGKDTIPNFICSVDKINKIYSTLINQDIEGNTIIVRFNTNNNEFKYYYIDINKYINPINPMLFNVYGNYSIIFGSDYNGNQKIISLDLNNNKTNMIYNDLYINSKIKSKYSIINTENPEMFTLLEESPETNQTSIIECKLTQDFRCKKKTIDIQGQSPTSLYLIYKDDWVINKLEFENKYNKSLLIIKILIPIIIILSLSLIIETIYILIIKKRILNKEIQQFIKQVNGNPNDKEKLEKLIE